jgi:hypothetical protein
VPRRPGLGDTVDEAAAVGETQPIPGCQPELDALLRLEVGAKGLRGTDGWPDDELAGFESLVESFHRRMEGKTIVQHSVRAQTSASPALREG